MKIYIVLEFKHELAKVTDLFVNRSSANERIIRLKAKLPVQDQTTYHVIAKSVKGLAGLRFEIEGKKRYLSSTKSKKRKMSACLT